MFSIPHARPKLRRAAARPGLDVAFLAILLLLLCYGLLMLYSAGYAVALYRRGDAYAYIRPQLLFAALGVAAMYAASLVDYHIWHRLAWPLLGVSLVLLVIVLFMPEYNGCKRWLVLPGLGTLQPSEIAKFSVVLVFSHIISLNHDRMKTFSTGVLPFGLVLGAVAVLMLLETAPLGHRAHPRHRRGCSCLSAAPGFGGSASPPRSASGPLRRRSCCCRTLCPMRPAALPPGRTPSPTRWAKATRPSRACTPIASGGLVGLGVGQQPPEIPLCARTAKRLHLLDPVRRTRLCGGGAGHPAVPYAVFARHVHRRARAG